MGCDTEGFGAAPGPAPARPPPRRTRLAGLLGACYSSRALKPGDFGEEEFGKLSRAAGPYPSAGLGDGGACVAAAPFALSEYGGLGMGRGSTSSGSTSSGSTSTTSSRSCSSSASSDGSLDDGLPRLPLSPQPRPGNITGTPCLDFQQFPVGTYIKLPRAVVPLMSLLSIDSIVLVARPSGCVSAGLEHYEAAVPAPVLAAAPIVVVVDAPNRRAAADSRYRWAELPLADVFKLDVSGMGGMEDYLALLSKKGRWNFRDRQRKFHAGLDVDILSQLQPTTELLDELWPLYRATGERNGFLATSEADFREMHLTMPNLMVMLMRDKDTGEVVTFCTGVRAGETLIAMWIGTNYANPKARACSVYFNAIYEFVRIAIADPTVACVDLGAAHRSEKIALGFKPEPVSLYVRCRSRVQRAIYKRALMAFFNPRAVMRDP